MASREAGQPNVIVILADDHGCWAMGCAGNEEIRTPNLDRLSASGMRLENFFCTSPVCSPARASLLTGRIPSQHGVHDWIRAGNARDEPDKGGRLVEYLRGQPGYTDVLAANGYVCGLSGKWHLGDSHHPQKGFSFWQAHAHGAGPYYDWPKVRGEEVVAEPGYVSDGITDDALGFLDAQADTDAPFYLSVHYTAPHSPWEREHHPKDLYDDYHAHCPFDSVPNDPPHPWQTNTAPVGADEERRRGILSGYFAAVTAMDANIGRILDWLEERHLRENTLVFFSSDNGMNMGHHGIWGKGNGTFPLNMYDTSVKVPALFSRPGHVPQGQVCGAMLSQYDFMPTLLAYLGMEDPGAAKLPGKSFAPLLRGEATATRQSVVVYDEYGPVRMIRTREWKYVHRYPYGPHELYDLVNDPGETSNLYGHELRKAEVQELKARLEGWFLCYVDPMLDGTREPVTGKGQLGLAGPAGNGENNFAGDWYYVADGGQNAPSNRPGSQP
ncbi:MAG TPA: sulfatase-like hydrolase/transferase [Phycisphaerae bacterium]|nr:sulfatase-like hydrolase/transferase [Phycisphaerae bacterium]